MAAPIASGPAKEPVTGFRRERQQDLYPVLSAKGDATYHGKLDLLLRADRAARAADPPSCRFAPAFEMNAPHPLAASDGTFASDTQPLARFNVFVIAKDGANIARGSAGGGGRVELDYFQNEKTPESFAKEAVRQAILQLHAVLACRRDGSGPRSGLAGVLLHEAVGHGLEADFNRKGTSAFSVSSANRSLRQKSRWSTTVACPTAAAAQRR